MMLLSSFVDVAVAVVVNVVAVMDGNVIIIVVVAARVVSSRFNSSPPRFKSMAVAVRNTSVNSNYWSTRTRRMKGQSSVKSQQQHPYQN